MYAIALKMLMGDRGKYLGIIMGLTFASLLITQQSSIFTGLMTRTYGAITDLSQPDIWVMDPKVQFIDDLEVRAKCINERPFVKNFGITEPDNPLLAVFKVYAGEAYFWTMADSMKEDKIPRVKF